MSVFVYIKKKYEEEFDVEDSVVMDVFVGCFEFVQGEFVDKWEFCGNGLWVRCLVKKKLSDLDDVIMDVDVLYGDDVIEVRDGWVIIGILLLLSGGFIYSVYFIVWRGVLVEVKKLVLCILDNGRFKIMQIVDLYLSMGVGLCWDVVFDSY